MLQLNNDQIRNDENLSYEWLDTNGLGGWASSTVSGVNTRRYHGLLVAAINPPIERAVLVAHLNDAVEINGIPHPLTQCECCDQPLAFNSPFKQTFRQHLFPAFTFEASGIHLTKTIAAIHGENTTLIRYELSADSAPVILHLTPLFAGRDYHHENSAEQHAPMAHEWTNSKLRVETGPGSTTAYIQAPNASFTDRPEWIRNIRHRVETYRGLDDREDLYQCGTFSIILQPGKPVFIMLSDKPTKQRNAKQLFKQEAARRKAITAEASDEIEEHLRLAADQFIVARGEKLQTVIAGYPWFTDWGRDTMIALPGLCLTTMRFETARRIIQAFAEYISEGMIPNRFPDGGNEPEYNTVDATLWMFVALLRYHQASNEEALVLKLYPKLKDIIAWHRQGTRYNIRMETDGLLTAGEHGTQLTWMDAKVGDWVVTPRQGKAVEINALWHNALKIMGEFATMLDQPNDQQEYATLAEQVCDSFQQAFWNTDTGCLFDCIDGDRRDAAIRPNQLFAISLPFPLLTPEQGRSVLAVVEEKLVTPVGLRSLAPDDPDYQGWYGGDQVSRDGAYHQGTVWSWLAGPYLDACLNLYSPEEARQKAQPLLDGLQAHLSKAGIGSVSEVFDGDAPHSPRGCTAQAWGVAEFLRLRSFMRRF